MTWSVEFCWFLGARRSCTVRGPAGAVLDLLQLAATADLLPTEAACVAAMLRDVSRALSRAAAQGGAARLPNRLVAVGLLQRAPLYGLATGAVVLAPALGSSDRFRLLRCARVLAAVALHRAVLDEVTTRRSHPRAGLDRGDALDELVAKTDRLEESAISFSSNASRLKKGGGGFFRFGGSTPPKPVKKAAQPAARRPVPRLPAGRVISSDDEDDVPMRYAPLSAPVAVARPPPAAPCMPPPPPPSAASAMPPPAPPLQESATSAFTPSAAFAGYAAPPAPAAAAMPSPAAPCMPPPPPAGAEPPPPGAAPGANRWSRVAEAELNEAARDEHIASQRRQERRERRGEKAGKKGRRGAAEEAEAEQAVAQGDALLAAAEACERTSELGAQLSAELAQQSETLLRIDLMPAVEEETAEEKAERARRKKADAEAAIDEMFADLETVVKYVGKLLFAATRLPASKLLKVPAALRAVVAIVLVAAICVLVVLPTFFAVLVVRMVKVETTKASFVKRAAVLAGESAAEHTARIGRLFLRSLPLSLLLVAAPPVVVLVVIPDADGDALRREIGFYATLAFVSIVVVLQLQGTVRAIVTFKASEVAARKTSENAKVVVKAWWRKLRARRSDGDSHFAAVLGELPHLGIAAPTFDAAEFSLAGFGGDAVKLPDFAAPWPTALQLQLPYVPLPAAPWYRNAALYLSIAVEALQLSFFAMRFAVAAPRIDVSAPRFNAAAAWGAWADEHFVPAVFIHFGDPTLRVPAVGDVHLLMSWGSAALVLLLVLVIVGRMMLEMWRYEAAQHDAAAIAGASASLTINGDVEDGVAAEMAAAVGEAEGAFFHGFLGSILYGHGNPKAVPPLLCTVVQLLCDTLFFSVVGNLGMSLSCFVDGQAHVTAAPSVQCWGAAHRASMTASLVAFGFFVPLSIMVAPVLAEANKAGSKGAVKLAKPYTMVSTAAKVIVVMFTVLASQRVLPCMIAALALNVFLVLLIAVWSGRTVLAQPASSRAVNAVRISTGAGAVLATLVPLGVYLHPVAETATALGPGLKYVVVGAIVFVFDAVVPAAMQVVVAAQQP
jgi:hypothetical protein